MQHESSSPGRCSPLENTGDVSNLFTEQMTCLLLTGTRMTFIAENDSPKFPQILELQM